MLFIKLFLWGGSSLCLVEAQYYAREPAHLKYFEDFAQSKGMPHPGFPHSYEAKLEYPAPEFDHPINHPPNTIASQDPPLAIMENSLWTSAVNATWFILPINRSAVQESIPFNLLPAPVSHENPVFPAGFPNDTHPVIAQIGYRNDIQQAQGANISKFMIGALFIPYVNVLEDPDRPYAFRYSLHNWVGHAHHEDHIKMDQVESIGASSGPDALSKCSFEPAGPAYNQVDVDKYSARMRHLHGLVEAMAPELITMDFTTDYTPHYMNHTFHYMLNQPLVLNPEHSSSDELQCSRDTIYFNEPFSHPTFRKGTVTLHDGIDEGGFAGTYDNVEGFSATGQQIGYPSQSCLTVWDAIDTAAVV